MNCLMAWTLLCIFIKTIFKINAGVVRKCAKFTMHPAFCKVSWNDAQKCIQNV